MRYYRVDSEYVEEVKFENEYSTLFNLKAFIKPGLEIKALNPHQKEMLLPIREKNGVSYIALQPQFRVSLSVGVAFSIPVKYQLRVTPNKKLSLETGVTLLDGMEIYDSDFTDEIKVTLINMSDTPVYIFNKDIVAQATLNKVLEYTLDETNRKIAYRTFEKNSKEEDEKSGE